MPYDPSNDKRVAAEYEGGDSLRVLAERYGTSPPVIRRVLDEQQIQVRDRADHRRGDVPQLSPPNPAMPPQMLVRAEDPWRKEGRPPSPLTQDIARMFEHGSTVEAIADAVGLEPASVRARLAREGLGPDA